MPLIIKRGKSFALITSLFYLQNICHYVQLKKLCVELENERNLFHLQSPMCSWPFLVFVQVKFSLLYRLSAGVGEGVGPPFFRKSGFFRLVSILIQGGGSPFFRKLGFSMLVSIPIQGGGSPFFQRIGIFKLVSIPNLGVGVSSTFKSLKVRFLGHGLVSWTLTPPELPLAYESNPN